jgi:hypothetical protein
MENLTSVESDVNIAENALVPAVNDADLAVELGIWLSGLESFVSGGYRTFRTDADGVADTLKEFELTRSVLLRCASLNSRLMASGFITGDSAIATDRQLAGLGRFFRDSILLGECMIRSASVGVAEWEAWSRAMAERMAHMPGSQRMIKLAITVGEQYLPEVFRDVEASAEPGRAELSLILPRFGRVLKWLNVIGEMLRADEPLKPALIIFSSVNEQVQDLVGLINNRLERFAREENETFSALDAAAYTASMELKKVYTKELAGLARLRPSPTIYARMETGYSLLNDGFQQMLAEFARSIDPRVNVIDLFPDFATKLERSVRLRKELYDLGELVRKVETDPAKENVDEVQQALFQFMGGSMRFLFYKDTETVERFVEEIIVTKQNKDLVPILHRFGAYLDTLFGQVNLRAVLAGRPFQS